MSFLIKQIQESGNRLKHKADSFSNRCVQLTESIKESVEQKITIIKNKEKVVLQEVEMIKSQQIINYESINNRIEALKEKIETNVINGKSSSKVSLNNVENVKFIDFKQLISKKLCFFRPPACVVILCSIF